MDNLRGGDWGEIQNNAHRVRSMHSRSSLFSVVFMCLISPTQKFKLEKSTLNSKEWGRSRFDESLELWIFILDYFVAPAPSFCLNPVSYGSIFLLLQNNTWQRNLKRKRQKEKTIDSYSSYVRLFGFYTQQNVNSAANFVFTSKTGLPRVVLDQVLQWVLFVPEIFVSPLSVVKRRNPINKPAMNWTKESVDSSCISFCGSSVKRQLKHNKMT